MLYELIGFQRANIILGLSVIREFDGVVINCSPLPFEDMTAFSLFDLPFTTSQNCMHAS
jgi:hypothetical protein